MESEQNGIDVPVGDRLYLRIPDGLAAVTWRYSDGSASGLVGVWPTDTAAMIFELLEEYSETRSFALHHGEGKRSAG